MKQNTTLEVEKEVFDIQGALDCLAQNNNYLLRHLDTHVDDTEKYEQNHSSWYYARHSWYFLHKPLGSVAVERNKKLQYKFYIRWEFTFEEFIEQGFNLNITFFNFNLLYNCYSYGAYEAVEINQQNSSFCGRRPFWMTFFSCDDLKITFKTGRHTRSYFTFGYQITEKTLLTTQFQTLEKAQWQFRTGIRQAVVQVNQREIKVAITFLFVVPKLKFIQLKLNTQFPLAPTLIVLDGPGELSKRMHFNKHNTLNCSTYQCTALFLPRTNGTFATVVTTRALASHIKKEKILSRSEDFLEVRMKQMSCFGEKSKVFCPIWLKGPKFASINLTMTNISYRGLLYFFFCIYFQTEQTEIKTFRNKAK